MSRSELVKINQDKLKALADKVFSVMQTQKSQIEASNQQLERLRNKQDQDYLTYKQKYDALVRETPLHQNPPHFNEVKEQSDLYEKNKKQAFVNGFPLIPAELHNKSTEEWPSETKLHDLMWKSKAYQQMAAIPQPGH